MHKKDDDMPIFETDSPQPRRGTPANTGSPTPTPVRPAESPINWGVVGPNTLRPTANGRGFQVVRVLQLTGLRYDVPPLPTNSIRWEAIRRVPAGVDSYSMTLPVPVNPGPTQRADFGVRTLLEIRAELAPALASTDAAISGPARTELDLIVDRLLALCEHLHEKGCGLGLLNPEGVLIIGHGADLQIVLPDLGFVYEGVRKVDWLDPNKELVRLWSALWDDGADPVAVQQIGQPTQFGKGPIADAKTDLRKLARLVGWLLTGQVARNLGGAAGAGRSVWDVLNRTLNGDAALGSVMALRQALKAAESRPSTYFQKVRLALEPTTGGSSRWAGVLAVLMVLVAGAVVTWVYFPGPRHDRPVTLEEIDIKKPVSPLPVASRMAQPLARAMQAKSGVEQIDAVIELYRAPMSGDLDLHKQELEARERIHFQALNRLRAEVDQLTEDFVTDHGRQFEIIETVTRARASLRRLENQNGIHKDTKAEEKKCIESFASWLEQRS